MHVVRGVVGYFWSKMPKKNYYAVRTGRTTGVYNSWSECEAQVKKYPGAVYKGFQEYSSADAFVNESGGYGGRSHVSSARAHVSSAHVSSAHVSSAQVSSARERYSGNFVGGSRTRKSNSGGGRTNWSQPSSSNSTRNNKACPIVYSDGCCRNNGFHGAEAGVGVYWGQGSSHNISEKLLGHPTNQRAEVVAACRAIESAIEQGHSAVKICTDSKYTINAATQWIGSWKKNGWQTSLHHDVKNRSDMERLDNLCRKVDVTWTHVPGHVGIPGNEAADSLAKAGSNRGQ